MKSSPPCHAAPGPMDWRPLAQLAEKLGDKDQVNPYMRRVYFHQLFGTDDATELYIKGVVKNLLKPSNP